MRSPASTRRSVLAAIGGAMPISLAGCLESNSPVPDGGSGDERAENERGANGDHDHGHGHELGHPEADLEVSMESDNGTHHFVPHIVHIEEGGTVTWILESGVHDTVAYHPDNADLLPSSTERRLPADADPWASDLYRTEGETFERTFETPGIYDYVCTVVEHGHGPDRGRGHRGHHQTHEATGMVGRVIVGWPDLDSDDQPALRAPSENLPDSASRELGYFNDRTREAIGHRDDH